MEEKYTFGDKEYTKQEVIDYGRSHYPRVSRVVTRSVGLGMFGLAFSTCFLGGCALSLHAETMSVINFSICRVFIGVLCVSMVIIRFFPGMMLFS